MPNDASGRAEEFLGRLHGRISAEPETGDGLISYSEVLGRRVRTGDWDDQAISTYDKIHEAIDRGDMAAAAELADFFVDEAEVIFAIYRDWGPKLIDFLRERGVTDDELVEINERILALVRTPDGRPFHARRMWGELRALVREFCMTCGTGDQELARKQIAHIRDHWQISHDHDVDHLYGLLDEIVRRWGETAMTDVWDFMVGPFFDIRYAKFDISQYSWSESLPTNVYLALEAMRGHLVGPGRRGNIEFEEHDDHYTFRFDPCGSGGHIVRGDEVFHTPPRPGPPYGWKVLEEEHDFAWNKKGVCLYCTNCCVLMQKKPIEEFGYPVRVVEPPTYPDTKDVKCTWHVYKDPRDVPERYYTDVGATKPASLGGGGDEQR